MRRLIKNRELIHQKYKNMDFMPDSKLGNLSKDDQFIRKVHEIIEENLENSDENLNVNLLSQKLNLSITQLYRKVKALTDYSPVEFIRSLRLARAAEMLVETNYSVKEVCYKVGFNSPSYFVKCFREKYKVTPYQYSMQHHQN
jgi:AraC-like DNA-binding protein